MSFSVAVVQVTQGHLEDESCLMQPLLEVQCQMYQLRELIATRAANTVMLIISLFVFNFIFCTLFELGARTGQAGWTDGRTDAGKVLCARL